MAEPTSSPPDADPIAALLAAAPTRRRRRLPWYLAAAAVASVVAVALLVVLGRAEQPDYGPDTRAEFLAACTEDGGAPVEPACRCIYDELVASVPYRSTAAELPAGVPLEVPDDVQAIIEGCVARVGPTG